MNEPPPVNVSATAMGSVRLTTKLSDAERADGLLARDRTPDQARELAALLVRAADEADESADTYPTVTARELRAGDVLNGDGPRVGVYEVWGQGDTVHVRWQVHATGKRWLQSYAADASVKLRRRGPDSP